MLVQSVLAKNEVVKIQQKQDKDVLHICGLKITGICDLPTLKDWSKMTKQVWGLFDKIDTNKKGKLNGQEVQSPHSHYPLAYLARRCSGRKLIFSPLLRKALPAILLGYGLQVTNSCLINDRRDKPKMLDGLNKLGYNITKEEFMTFAKDIMKMETKGKLIKDLVFTKLDWRIYVHTLYIEDAENANPVIKKLAPFSKDHMQKLLNYNKRVEKIMVAAVKTEVLTFFFLIRNYYMIQRAKPRGLL